MKPTYEILEEVDRLPARERAAAIAHYIYMKTAERVGWGKRVPTEWAQLEQDAKEFNMASMDAWSREPQLYDAWCEAMQQLRHTGRPDGG
ncbi:MAG TPA: hypothetical protein VFQ76_01225 [Longimicrobiaceae bacterium]|nr:hypothetical protein [Longimicrobiaceae bacterium]